MQEALDRAGVPPDVVLEAADPVLFIHRTLPEGDIYFVSNQHDGKIQLNPTFRVSGMQPELWDAVHGTLRDLPGYTDDGAGITVPIELDGYESAFLVFRKPAAQPSSSDADNYPDAERLVAVSGPWRVTFLKTASTSFTRQRDLLSAEDHRYGTE